MSNFLKTDIMVAKQSKTDPDVVINVIVKSNKDILKKSNKYHDKYVAV